MRTALLSIGLLVAGLGLGADANAAPDCDGVATVAGQDITLELVTNQLTRPVDATHAPGDVGRLFVVEARGTIRIIDLDNDTLTPTPFLDIQGPVRCCGERGLLGLAFHPDYETNGFFYVYYTGDSGGGDSFISRFQVTDDPDVADPGSEVELLSFDQPYGNHNGGQVLFGPNDGYLYIFTGDGGSGGDPENRAQNTNSFLGKILRLDVDNQDPGKNYAIPADNPFNAAGDGIRDEIWALGLRNPWRTAFDSETGDLYIADVGQDVWEEISFQPGDSTGGENYEWRRREADNNFNNGTLLTAGTATPPIHEYRHGGGDLRGNSITGGKVYRGCSMPDLRGRYFFADYENDWVASLLVVDGQVTDLRNHTSDLNAGIAPDEVDQISAFGEDARGEIYICDLETKLFRIVAVGTPSTNNFPAASIATVPSPAVVDFKSGSAEITLDGSGSDDGDGGTQGLTYAWEKMSGPNGDSIAAPGAASSAVTFAVVGEYVYRLTVDDGQSGNNTDSAETTVTIQVRFIRGDSNSDGTRDVSDPIYSLAFLFLAEHDPECMDALDSNDDGGIDISDPVHTLISEFLGTVAIPAPEDCGVDPTADTEDCSTTTCPAEGA